MGAQKAGIAIFLFAQAVAVFADKPCKSVNLKENRSVLCMCTAEYCDDITRTKPSKGRYVTYISSEDGLRFEKRVKHLEPYHYEKKECRCPDYKNPTLYLDTSTQYQEIKGFGGALTDAVAINWDRLTSRKLKQHFVDSYFGQHGLEYNMMRVPIGGCDFSTHPYTYNEYPIGDAKLSNFSLAEEDYKYKLPLIKECFRAAPEAVHIVASTWSPPVWMKTNGKIDGLGTLKPQYFQTYADYHLKFLKAYAKEGVPVWAITTTNEPTNGMLIEDFPFNSLGWTLQAQGRWIANNLGPTLRNSTFKDVKILCHDDQRNFLPYYVTELIAEAPEAKKYIDGVATHYYQDERVPPEQIAYSMANFPDMFIISTEACTGVTHSPSVDLGSWDRAVTYANDILQDLNYNYTGWIDWNMCLDEKGGPNWSENYVDSPIIVSNDGASFYKQPMFYAMGHVAKFLPRGSRRIRVDTLSKKAVDNVAFLTPHDTIVTILLNTGEATVVDLVTCNQQAKVSLERHSIATVEFTPEDCKTPIKRLD